jgi:hypothetical protein
VKKANDSTKLKIIKNSLLMIILPFWQLASFMIKSLLVTYSFFQVTRVEPYQEVPSLTPAAIYNLVLTLTVHNLRFFSLRMKKQDFFHLKNRIFLTFMDVSWMVMSVGQFICCFSWMSTAIYGCFMVFLTENEKTGFFPL